MLKHINRTLNWETCAVLEIDMKQVNQQIIRSAKLAIKQIEKLDLKIETTLTASSLKQTQSRNFEQPKLP